MNKWPWLRICVASMPTATTFRCTPTRSNRIRSIEPWLGKAPLTGLSLQNMWNQVHSKTLLWVRKSRESGRPWICANDEQGKANQGVPPDPGYADFGGTVKMENGTTYDLHDIRKQTLWGNLMAGGAGVMYYFGYQLPENDLKCEDFRSRDKSWDYCRIAQEFLICERDSHSPNAEHECTRRQRG